MPVLEALLGAHIDALALGYHLVLQRPAQSAAQLRHHGVAVAQQVDVEVDVADALAGHVNLRHVGGEPTDDFRDGRHLEAGADDDDEVHLVAVVLRQPLGEGVGEGLAEKGDVGLHDAGLGNVVLALLRVVLTAPAAPARSPGSSRTLPLGPPARRVQFLDAARTAWDLARLDVRKDLLALDLVVALDAGGGTKGAVTLDEAVGGDTGLDLEVVDVLGVICEELAPLVQHGDELVRRGVPILVGNNVLGDGVEDARVFLKDGNIKHFLGIVDG